jgi:hypothetical protein
MSTISIKIPDSVRNRVEDIAREDGVTVDDFVASVLLQRVAVANADSYVRSRAKSGSASQLVDLLGKAPNVVPDPADRIQNKEGEQGGDGDAEEAV